MTSQQRCGRSQCSTARPATRFHQTMWPRDHVCLPNVTFNPTGSPPAGKFRSSHRRVRGRRGRPSVVLQLWVTLKFSRLFAFKGGAHALCSTRLKILPCFLSQTFATTRKFVRSTAPRRWSSPTPPTSTSAGTRCPTLLVGCEPAQTPPPDSQPHPLAWPGVCCRYGNNMCGHSHLIGRSSMYVCVRVLWMQKATEKRANTHTQKQGGLGGMLEMKAVNCWAARVNFFIFLWPSFFSFSLSFSAG